MGDPSQSRTSVLKLLLLSFSFLLVFLAFNGTQTIMSSLIPGNLGYWSISCIYISFMTCALFLSTGVVLIITPKWSMFLGSLIYAGFIAANLYPQWYTLIPLAVLLGLAASILWAGEGAYVTAAAMVHAAGLGRPARSSLGFFNGTFFGIFQFSMVIGNVLSSLVLRRGNAGSGSSDAEESHRRSRILFYVYVAICAVGIVGLLVIPHPQPKLAAATSAADEAEKKKKKETAKVFGVKRLLGALVMLKDPKMLLYFPFLIFTGLEQGFVFGDFTAAFIKPAQGVAMVGFVMAVFGAANSLCSVLLGRVADRVGPRWIAVLGAAIFSAFLATLAFARNTHFGQSLVAAFLWAFVLGVADAAIFSVFCNAATAMLFSDRAEAAFSNLKVFQSGGTALMFFLGPTLSFNVKLIILAASLTVGCIGLVILDRFVFPLSAANNQQGKVATSPEEPDVQTTRRDETTPLVQ